MERQLKIKVGVVTRLGKETKFYMKELEGEEKKMAALKVCLSSTQSDRSSAALSSHTSSRLSLALSLLSFLFKLCFHTPSR